VRIQFPLGLKWVQFIVQMGYNMSTLFLVHQNLI